MHSIKIRKYTLGNYLAFIQLLWNRMMILFQERQLRRFDRKIFRQQKIIQECNSRIYWKKMKRGGKAAAAHLQEVQARSSPLPRE